MKTGLVTTLIGMLLLPATASPAFAEPPAWPRHMMPVVPGPLAKATMLSALQGGNDLTYHGGPVQKMPTVYLVFWGWFGLDPAGEAPYLVDFLSGIGGSDWAQVLTEYSESARGSIVNSEGQLAGIWWDDALPVEGGVPVLEDNILVEVQRAVDHFGYDRDANYIIATPTLRNGIRFAVPGGYCAWHSWMRDRDRHVVAFTNLPYIPDAPAGACGEKFVNPGPAGRLDGVSIVAGHEYAETITDPTRGSGWLDQAGEEVGDKCAWIRQGPGAAYNTILATGTFAVQALWSNQASACA